MLYIVAKEDKKNKYEKKEFLDCKEKNITQLIFPTSFVLEVQKGKPCDVSLENLVLDQLKIAT